MRRFQIRSLQNSKDSNSSSANQTNQNNSSNSDNTSDSISTQLENNAYGTNKVEYQLELTTNLQQNMQMIKQALGQSPDVIVREIRIGSTGIPGAIAYVDNLVDKQTIQSEVLRSVIFELSDWEKISGQVIQQQIIFNLEKRGVTAGETKTGKSLDELSLFVLSGDTVLLIDGIREFIIIGTRKYPTRSIEQPSSEASVRGPRDSFVESVRTNMALIRRRLRDPNLQFESYIVGRRGKTEVVLAYIKGIASNQLVEEIRHRLKQIDIDEVPETGYIEQLIEDNFLSPFPQIQHTERPDKVVSTIIAGSVAILLDGTPFVLMAPVTFSQMLQAPEDYYERWMIGTLLRSLRYTTAFIAVFLPSLYIALVSYHPGLIPTKLALSIAATREGVPFPAAIEAFLLEATLEILREAGLRLPKAIGPTVSIVGGLVIGQSAVAAGIVSPIMLIIVSLGALASFSIPSYSVAITFRMLRFAFMLAASVLGLYGIIMAYIFLNVHIVRLQSFGTVFSAPFAPYKFRDWKDLVIRLPLSVFKKRPAILPVDDEKRMS